MGNNKSKAKKTVNDYKVKLRKVVVRCIPAAKSKHFTLSDDLFSGMYLILFYVKNSVFMIHERTKKVFLFNDMDLWHVLEKKVLTNGMTVNAALCDPNLFVRVEITTTTPNCTACAEIRLNELMGPKLEAVQCSNSDLFKLKNYSFDELYYGFLSKGARDSKRYLLWALNANNHVSYGEDKDSGNCIDCGGLKTLHDLPITKLQIMVYDVWYDCVNRCCLVEFSYDFNSHTYHSFLLKRIYAIDGKEIYKFLSKTTYDGKKLTEIVGSTDKVVILNWNLDKLSFKCVKDIARGGKYEYMNEKNCVGMEICKELIVAFKFKKFAWLKNKIDWKKDTESRNDEYYNIHTNFPTFPAEFNLNRAGCV